MKPWNAEETGVHEESGACRSISEMLSRIGDKWSLQVVRRLGFGPLRFKALRLYIVDIRQKMLTLTLRQLERDGFVSRKVTPSTPPQVEYALTDLGRELNEPVSALAEWTLRNRDRIEAARAAFAARQAD
jgi:DNA-binding HxlR family transcriptional regulator